MDPTSLAALNRTAEEVKEAGQLIARMSGQQIARFQELSEQQQKMLVTDRQLRAADVPKVVDVNPNLVRRSDLNSILCLGSGDISCCTSPILLKNMFL